MSKLPSGWQIRKLAEIGTVQTGIALNGDVEHTDPVQLPYLRVANVQDGHIDLSEIKRITISRSLIHRYSLRPGDVLMTEGGDFDKLGRGAVWHGEIEPCVHQNHVFAVRPDTSIILPDFLAAYCESEPGKRYFLSCSKQTTNLASINSTQLKAMPIVVPPRIDQARIMAVINEWNEAIDNAEGLIKAVRSKYRGHLDPLINQPGFESSRIDEICNVNIRSLPTKTDPGFQFDYFDIASAEDGGDDDLSGRITFASAPSRARRMVDKEGVVYATVRPLLRRLFVAKRRDDAVYSTGYSILEPKECCLVGFLKHALVSPEAERQIFARLTGSGYPAISEKDLCEVQIPLPAKDHQFKTCEMLDALQQQESLYLRYVRALEAQKRGLMQQLLTGDCQLDARFDPPVLPNSPNGTPKVKAQ